MLCICTVGFADKMMSHPSACLIPLTGCFADYTGHESMFVCILCFCFGNMSGQSDGD